MLTRCPILYDDGTLLAVDKPSGLLSHPNVTKKAKQEGQKGGVAAFEGNYDFQDRRFDTPEGPVWLIHRLDQDASGVLLATKSKQARDQCRLAFEHLKVLKNYWVLVKGFPKPSKGKWQNFMTERRFAGKVRVQIRAGKKPNAKLFYSEIKTFPKWEMALLEIQLLTGRTHQIRVQAASHGHPVAGDGVYGDFLWNRKLRKELGLKRIFLHAACLGIPHPKTGTFLKLESPLPNELLACLPDVPS